MYKAKREQSRQVVNLPLMSPSYQQKDNMNNINRTDDNGYTIISEDDAIERFENMLDECFPLVKFGSLSYSPSEVLKRVDPTAYRCEFLNWLDCEELTIDED